MDIKNERDNNATQIIYMKQYDANMEAVTEHSLQNVIQINSKDLVSIKQESEIGLQTDELDVKNEIDVIECDLTSIKLEQKLSQTVHEMENSYNNIKQIPSTIFTLMATREWCVVAFDDGVQLVPNNWIQGKECFWPTFKSRLRYEKSVKNCENPQDTWPLYAIRILGTYSSYEIAKRELKLAEEQLDLNTDHAESKKQSKFKRKRVISSSDEEVSEEEIHSLLKPSPLEPIKHDQRKNKAFSTENDSNYDDLSEDDMMVPLKPLPSSTCSSPSIASCNNIQGMTTHSIQSVLSDEDFKKQISQDLSFIKRSVIKLNQRMALIEANCKQKVSEGEDNDEHHLISRDYDGVMKNKFPLQTYEELTEMEAKLQAEPEFKSSLIRYCSRIGGYKIDEITKLILRKLFSNQLASMYSWLGAKKKKIFSHLVLSEVILNSVRANNVAANATDKDIIECIKNWLRHAGTKDKNNRERKSLIT